MNRRPFAGISFTVQAAVWLILTPGVLLATAMGAETSAKLSSFHVVDAKSRGESRTSVVTAVLVDPARGVLFTAGDDHRIRVFKEPNDQLLVSLPAGGWVHDLALDHTGQYLAAVDERGTLVVWRWESRQAIYQSAVSFAALRAVTFSPDGRVLAVAGFEPKVFLLEALTGRRLAELPCPGRDLRAVAFSPDGAVLAAAGGRGIVSLWQMPVAQRRIDIQASPRRLNTLAFAPRGAILATGGEEGVVTIWQWDSQPARNLAKFSLPVGQVTSLTYCNDGQNLAVGTTQNVIHLWDVSTGSELARLEGHTGTVSCLVWTAEQASLASGSFDTTVRFWRLPTNTSLSDTSLPDTSLSERVPNPVNEIDRILRQ